MTDETIAGLVEELREAILDSSPSDRELSAMLDKLDKLEAAIAQSGWEEELTESDKDVAIAQAVEFAQYVSDAAKGSMVERARHFLSVPYAQQIAARLKPIPPTGGDAMVARAAKAYEAEAVRYGFAPCHDHETELHHRFIREALTAAMNARDGGDA
jgi:hypothetical protein